MTEINHDSHGFTILELIVAITIIGILTSLVLTISPGMRVTSRDQERADDIASLIRRLETGYIAQELGEPAYPSTVELLNDISNNTRYATRLDKAALVAPGVAGASSVVAATSTSTTSPISSGPTKNQYVYQPLTSANTLCTANPSTGSTTSTCVRFNFYYLNETSNTIKKVKSFYQQ